MEKNAFFSRQEASFRRQAEEKVARDFLVLRAQVEAYGQMVALEAVAVRYLDLAGDGLKYMPETREEALHAYRRCLRLGERLQGVIQALEDTGTRDVHQDRYLSDQD